MGESLNLESAIDLLFNILNEEKREIATDVYCDWKDQFILCVTFVKKNASESPKEIKRDNAIIKFIPLRELTRVEMEVLA